MKTLLRHMAALLLMLSAMALLHGSALAQQPSPPPTKDEATPASLVPSPVPQRVERAPLEVHGLTQLSMEALQERLSQEGWTLLAPPDKTYQADHKQERIEAQRGPQEVVVQLLHFRSAARANAWAQTSSSEGGAVAQHRTVVLVVAVHGEPAESWKVLDALVESLQPSSQAGKNNVPANDESIDIDSRPGHSSIIDQQISYKNHKFTATENVPIPIHLGAALLGSILGGSGGFWIGRMMDDSPDCNEELGCPYTPVHTILGTAIGIPLGAAAGTTIIGSVYNQDGSFFASALLSTCTTILGFLAGVAIGESAVLPIDAVLLLLPITMASSAAVGAWLGYEMTVSPFQVAP